MEVFNSLYWDQMEEKQKKARADFELKILDAINQHWTPLPHHPTPVVAIVDFSKESQLIITFFEKGSGHSSDIVTSASNSELIRSHRMWGQVLVSEQFGVKSHKFDLVTDPHYSATVFSSNAIQSIKIPVHLAKLRFIKWMYQEEHPYLT